MARGPIRNSLLTKNKPEPGLEGEQIEKPIETAQAAINADKQRRRDAAIADLSALCEKHQVSPVFITQIINGQVTQGIDFQAK